MVNNMYSIETKKLTKKFKDKIAVNGIDLNIKQGEFLKSIVSRKKQILPALMNDMD